MSKWRVDPEMSRRVSSHFGRPVKVGSDTQGKFGVKSKIFFVINHNDNAICFFRTFNSQAKKLIADHLQLKYHKHNMPPDEDKAAAYYKMHDEIHKETADAVIDRLMTASRTAVRR